MDKNKKIALYSFVFTFVYFLIFTNFHNDYNRKLFSLTTFILFYPLLLASFVYSSINLLNFIKEKNKSILSYLLFCFPGIIMFLFIMFRIFR
jgi:hypothetical protein